MMGEVIIYVAPPTTARGRWRVRAGDGREEERIDERQALTFAADHARAIEAEGGVAIVKVERSDGTWETFRA